MTNHFESIALGARSATRLFDLELVRVLTEKTGCKVHLYCNSPQQVKYFKGQDTGNHCASIVDAGLLLDAAVEPVTDEAAVIETAKRFEARMSCPISTIAVANRHLGRGFSLGGFYHPRSRYSENTSHIQMLNAYNKTLAFWEKEFTEKRISLVINAGKEAACMARVHGIPYRAMAGSRYKNYQHWAWNEHYDNPLVKARYEALTASEAASGDPLELSEPYYAHIVSRKQFLNDVGVVPWAKRSALAIAYFLYWNLRGYKKAKGYYLRDNLVHEFRCWREFRKLHKKAKRTLDSLKFRPFVYYPLHVEPETSLQTISPEFFYQLSLIAAVARDLPAEATLAIKEAFGAVGRRPDNFYDQILAFNNVVLLETMERGLDCAQNAAAVVTIAGTAGLEAAIAGVPVIAFGHHNVYNVLPHVQVVHDERDLRSHLRRAIDGSFDKPTMIADAQRLCRAIEQESFDMRQYDYVNHADFDPQSVEDAAESLLRSVNEPEVPVWQYADTGNATPLQRPTAA